MKVYVLSHGEYSSWTIDGIFSSLEALEKGKAKLIEDGTYNNFNDPDEYELDMLLSLERGPLWGLSIDCQTGELLAGSDSYDECLRHPRACVVQAWCNYQKWVITVRSPVSKEHAEKLAVEKRHEWLRIHAGNPQRFSQAVQI